MGKWHPPYKITSKINNLVVMITGILTQLDLTKSQMPLYLRKANRVKTIKSTLAIEGNTLTEKQVTDILNNKRVQGFSQEILEVKNALKLYNSMDQLKSSQGKDFLKSHKILMKGLIKTAGKYRSQNVVIADRRKIKHLAPKFTLVSRLMERVFNWIKAEKDLHPLILSSIVHYEIEFIHPFEDGNGRIGRFWQTLILKEHHEVFEYIPIENLIEKNQKKYYKALNKSDKAGNSTTFVEFMLEMIKAALSEVSYESIEGFQQTYVARMQIAKAHFLGQFFTRKDYMRLIKGISVATASRDLKKGLDEKNLKKINQKNQTQYKFNSL